MHVVAIVAQKGGTGKTTLALCLAVAGANNGRSVLVVDLDPQATASNWGDRRQSDQPVITSTQAARLPKVLAAAAESGADLAIIDTPPRLEQASMAAAAAANLILIPCIPAINDLDTLDTTIELLRHAGNTKAIVVLNSAPARGSRKEQAEEVVRDKGILIAPVTFGHRTAFPDAAAFGQTPEEYDPKGKAAEETERLYTFMCKHLNLLTSKQDRHAREARLATSNQ